MEKIIFIVTIFCAVQAVPTYEMLNFLNNTRATTNCLSAGLQCDGCDNLIACIDMGDNDFQEIVLEKCATARKTCKDLACTSDPNPGCLTGPDFMCNDVGIFPDPTDCQSYHICCKEGVKSSPQKCRGNYYYDPVTTYCRERYSPEQKCPEITKITCTKQGEMGPHPLNYSIFYICVANPSGEFVPQLRLCPNGRTFYEGICQ